MGCSKAVEIPRADYEMASKDPKGRYRVKLVDGASHYVEHYTLTDSTIVMVKLNPNDAYHKQRRETIMAPRADVASIAKYELARGQSFVVLSSAFVLGMLIWGLSTMDPIE